MHLESLNSLNATLKAHWKLLKQLYTKLLNTGKSIKEKHLKEKYLKMSQKHIK